MRKRLQTKETAPFKARDLPAFNEKPGRIRARYFWMGGGKGAFSKRAFFFSLFAFIAVLYIILCLARLFAFDAGLGAFVLGCNAAFGYNYYKNERGKIAGAPEGDVR